MPRPPCAASSDKVCVERGMGENRTAGLLSPFSRQYVYFSRIIPFVLVPRELSGSRWVCLSFASSSSVVRSRLRSPPFPRSRVEHWSLFKPARKRLKTFLLLSYVAKNYFLHCYLSPSFAGFFAPCMRSLFPSLVFLAASATRFPGQNELGGN